MKQFTLILITGLSGAGKSSVLQILEDMDFLCLDNFPPPLILDLLKIHQNRADGNSKNIALGIDIRWQDFLGSLFENLELARENGVLVQTFFLEANTETLVKRFSETRRRHPLGEGDLLAHIQSEKNNLNELRIKADFLLNTTGLTLPQLREQIRERLKNIHSIGKLSVNIISFGFKNGLPLNADLVYDVRFLPNPFYIPELKAKTGLEEGVADFIQSHAQSGEFLQRLEEFLKFLLPQYSKEGKSYLQIAIGCTGGKHRSVFISDQIFKILKTQPEYTVSIFHRDIEKK